MDDKKIKHEAMSYARKIKKEFARQFTSRSVYPSEKDPVSVFMAGSPGAGKTEASIQLLRIQGIDESQVIRIDPDEFRVKFKEYNGNNAHLFQGAISILVSRVIDMALKQKQSFLLDGTLASEYDLAKANIERSINKDRLVQIYYVYQEPLLAWDFVKAREFVEGRKIKRGAFIDQYFTARNNVNRLKKDFGNKVKLDLLLKNYDGTPRFYYMNVDNVDNHIREKYTQMSIEQIIPMD